MNQFFTTHPLFKTGLLALLFIPFLLIMGKNGPKEHIPEGYGSTIVAFEFASDTTEVTEVLNPHGVSDKLNFVNNVDFGFMLGYGLFLFLFMKRFGYQINNDFIVKSSWIVPIIVAADALENIQLLKLTETFPNFGDGTSGIITLLIVFTWTKWLLLGLVFSLIGFQMAKMKLSNKIIGFSLMIPLVLGLVGIISIDNRSIEDLFTLSIFGAFFLIFVYALTYKREQQLILNHEE